MSSDKPTKSRYGSGIGAEVLAAIAESDQAPAKDLLAQRGSSLSKMGGDVIFNQTEWVDPTLCKPSPVNARDYDLLTYEDCHDLIETIKSEGRQRVAATVRPTEDPNVPYEIVAGLRRHWSVSWLRANNYPDFKYLIDVQKMDDEAAFRFSDLENRARTDISDLERGRGYQEALARYYDNDSEKMSQRIGISKSQLYRYLQLANLDDLIVAALGGHRFAKVSHARDINAAIKRPEQLQLIIDEAKLIGVEQDSRKGGGEAPLLPSDVLKRLVKATIQRKAHVSNAAVGINAHNGKPMIEFTPGNVRTAATIKLLPKTGATREELREEVLKLVDQFFDARTGK